MSGADPRPALAPLERALLSYHAGCRPATVRVIVDDGSEYELAAALFFRSGGRWLAVDHAALPLCRGRVLDVGASAER